jgi:hypothetical protein
MPFWSSTSVETGIVYNTKQAENAADFLPCKQALQPVSLRPKF